MTTRWAIPAILLAMTVASGASAEKPSALVAAPAPADAAARQTLEVEWHGSWWPAEVLQRREGLTRIHYSGWGPEWDEWVSSARLRPTTRPLTSAHAGQRVEIEWHGSYWPGRVVAARSGFFKVRYAGYGPEWDEWVEIGRLHTTVTGR